MSEYDLLVRAQRAVLPDGERGADVAVKDGRIVAVEPLGLRPRTPGPTAVVELAADEVLLPGIVDSHVHVNDPGRTEWEGFESATRAAAAGGVTTIVDMPLNSIPPTVDVAALEVKRKAADGADVGRRGLLGRCRARQPRRPAAAARRGGLRLQVLPAALRRRRVPRAVAGRGRGGHARDRRVRRAAHRPRRGPRRDRARRERRRTRILRLPGLPSAAGGEPRHPAPHRAVPRDRLPHPHPPRVQRRRPADDPPGGGRRRAHLRGDLPALPDVHVGGDPRGGDAVQVLPADPGVRRTATCCGRGCATGRSTSSSPTTRRRPSTSSTSTPATSAPRGAASRRSSSGWRRSGPRRASAASRCPTSSAGCPAGRPTRPGSPTRAGSRSAPTPTSRCSRPTPSRSSTSQRLHHKNPITPYAGRTLTGTVRSTWLRGIRIDVAGPPRGRQLTRGEK